jgi:hypothetical protein
LTACSSRLIVAVSDDDSDEPGLGSDAVSGGDTESSECGESTGGRQVRHEVAEALAAQLPAQRARPENPSSGAAYRSSGLKRPLSVGAPAQGPAKKPAVAPAATAAASATVKLAAMTAEIQRMREALAKKQTRQSAKAGAEALAAHSSADAPNHLSARLPSQSPATALAKEGRAEELAVEIQRGRELIAKRERLKLVAAARGGATAAVTSAVNAVPSGANAAPSVGSSKRRPLAGPVPALVAPVAPVVGLKRPRDSVKGGVGSPRSAKPVGSTKAATNGVEPAADGRGSVDLSSLLASLDASAAAAKLGLPPRLQDDRDDPAASPPGLAWPTDLRPSLATATAVAGAPPPLVSSEAKSLVSSEAKSLVSSKAKSLVSSEAKSLSGARLDHLAQKQRTLRFSMEVRAVRTRR